MPTTLGTIIGEGFSSIIREDDNGRVYFKADADIDADGANGQNGGPAAYRTDNKGTESLGNGGMALRDGSHGAFDDDRATVQGTLARILGNGSTTGTMDFSRSASSRRDIRTRIQNQR